MFRSQHGSVCSPFAVIRRGKGLKHREIPLIQEAHELLDTYLKHREHLAKRWRERVTAHGEASWSRWPDGHLFLGQRGLLTERGIREIIAKSLSTLCHHQELKRVTSEARNSHHTQTGSRADVSEGRVSPLCNSASGKLMGDTLTDPRALCRYLVVIHKRSIYMTSRAKDEEREERIHMEIVVDANGPEEQAMGWYY
jgi:hypothetical protein